VLHDAQPIVLHDAQPIVETCVKHGAWC
jgi:hypothetical protein